VRIAVVQLWSPPYTDGRTGGMMNAGKNLAENLWQTGNTVDLMWIGDKDERHADPNFERVPLRRAPAVLAQQDAVIFTTAGSFRDKTEGPWWRPLLTESGPPFAVWIHDEVEIEKLPYRREFFDHPRCRLVMAITNQIAHAMGAFPPPPVLWYPGYPLTLRPNPLVEEREHLAVTTCRFTSRKRQQELVRDAGRGFMSNCIRLELHGADATWFYVRKVREEMERLPAGWSRYVTLRGHFSARERNAILRRAKWHLNLPAAKRGTFYPRIELSTLEAVENGCCPVVSVQSMPSPFEGVNSGAVRVDPLDPKQLERLAERLSFTDREIRQRNEDFRAWWGQKFPMPGLTAELTDRLKEG
jgi:hypothetical protein